MRIASCLVFAVLLIASPRLLGWPNPPKEVNSDEQILVAAGLSADGPALVEFFRQRARTDVDVAALTTWIKRLSATDPNVRAPAWKALVGHGAAALPLLRRASNDLGDPVVNARVNHCIQVIEGEGKGVLAEAAARLLALRKPVGALEALLDYLPAAEAAAVGEEIANALGVLAYPNGQPHPVLLAALQDPAPLRRAVAARALCRKDQLEIRPTLRKLLRDANPLVRLRVALALAEAEDVEAVPVLIGLLAELPEPHSRQAEEMLQGLAGEWGPNPTVQGDDDIARRIRRDAWAGWWRNTDSPALLTEFRRRTLSTAEQAKVAVLIEKLGDDSFDVRQRAAASLTAYGALANLQLREAARGPDPERVRLAEECLREIADKGGKPLPAAAVHLLALRRATGAVEALLDYLPFADNESMVTEVQAALAVLAVREGQMDPALIRALEDKQPARRAAAAEVVLQKGNREQRALVRKLLREVDPQVRLRTALALAARADKEAVPVLIESLAEEPSIWSSEAEEVLYRLAGEGGPKVQPASNTAGRRKQRDAWAAWWKETASRVDMTILQDQQRLLGYTLVAEGNNTGRVLELGRDGKPRWIIGDVLFPVDAYVLGGNRVLIAEYMGNRVTERDFKGKILWQKDLGANPINAQRLTNGNTFIATGNELLEVDRAAKTVWSLPFPAGVSAAYKARDGIITCLTNNAQCVRISREGKELKSFPINRSGFTSGIDVLPNGRVLIAEPNQGSVVEVDADGKTVWQAKTPGIASATRLPNGHTLVANHGMNSVTELDRAGKVVWEYKEATSVFRARRR
jgi:HEAT repeat protein